MFTENEMMNIVTNAFAQEKSRSISENVMWGKRRKFKDGKFAMGYSSFLGFKKPKQKGVNLEIDEDEAGVVRRIFTMFIDGNTYAGIAKALTRDDIGTPSGASEKWSPTTIKSILQNEKYSGNALLQKTFIDSYKTKNLIQNAGQLPQYWVENSHDAIIEMPTFELVQSEIQRRNELGNKLKDSLLSCRIKCDVCGEYYKARSWRNSNSENSTFWGCNKKYENAKPCENIILTENQVKEAFAEAFNCLLENKEQLLETLKADIESLNIKEITKNISEKREQIAQRERLTRFMALIEQIDTPISDFDLTLWRGTLDIIVANRDGGVTFKFKNGSEITLRINLESEK